MQTVTINFTVSGQTLKVTSLPIKIASNTVKYVKAVFALDSDWTGFDVVSAIWYNDFAQIAVVLDENGECMIPHEVLAKPDDVMVNLVGRDVVNDELVDRLTTYPAKALDVDANAKITGTETAPVTPSQFEQYIAIVEQLVGSVKDIDHTELNADYTLTIYYTDGTSDTVGPIRGAQGEAGNGILSAVLNPDYTLTLNYTNGQHDTVGPIRGAQGETGNGIQSIYLTGTSGAVKTYTILFTDGNTTEFQVTDGEVTNAVLESLMPTDTANGSIASFPDGQSVFPLKSLVAEIDPIQDLHGYDSPWVAGGGVNKIPYPYLGTPAPTEITVTDNGDGTLTVNGTATGTKYYYFFGSSDTAVPSWVKPSTNYCTNIVPTQTGIRTQFILYGKNGATTVVTESTAKTTPADFTNYRCAIVLAVSAGTYSNVLCKPILVEGSTLPNTWTPYSNICPISGWNSVGVTVTDDLVDPTDTDTYTTSLGTTVYGGTLDVVSGVLTVDKVIVDISTLGAVYNSTWKCWVLSGGISGAKVVSANTTATNAIASNMKAVQASGYTTSHDSATFAQNTNGYWFFDNGSTTPLDGTLCYELATPTTIQLTPTQVQTLLGTNNIFADSGDVSVEYVADIQGYIDKKL